MVWLPSSGGGSHPPRRGSGPRFGFDSPGARRRVLVVAFVMGDLRMMFRCSLSSRLSYLEGGGKASAVRADF